MAMISDEEHRDITKFRTDALAAAEFFRRAPALAVSPDAIIDLYCAMARMADIIEARSQLKDTSNEG
jgi:hypothetical protein